MKYTVIAFALFAALQHSGVQAGPKQSDVLLGSYAPKNIRPDLAKRWGLPIRKDKSIMSKGIGNPRVAHWNSNKIKPENMGAGNRWNGGRIPTSVLPYSFGRGWRVTIEDLSPGYSTGGPSSGFTPIGGN